jgi:hypothetical protein
MSLSSGIGRAHHYVAVIDNGSTLVKPRLADCFFEVAKILAGWGWPAQETVDSRGRCVLAKPGC